MWTEFNPNPINRRVGDCSVRAIAKALNVSWGKAYALLTFNGYQMGDMPSSDAVWGSVLRQHGFSRSVVPNACPECYTAEDFSKDHPEGVYVLGFGGHVATMIDGVIYDSWDSSGEIPQFYWAKEDTNGSL